MEWQCDGKAAPGQRALASAPSGCCPAALARLEPESPPARLPAARAPPTHGDEPVASCRRFVRQSGSNPLPRTTRALSSLMARAAGSQCSRFNIWASDDQTVWCPRRLCHRARFGDGLTSSRQLVGSLFAEKLASPRRASWPFFLAVPQFLLSSAFFPLCSPVSAISCGLGFRF